MNRGAMAAALWMLIGAWGCNGQQPQTEEELARAIYEAQGGDKELVARIDRFALRWRSEVGEPMLDGSSLDEAQREDAYKAFDDTMRSALAKFDDVVVKEMVDRMSREELEQTLRHLKASSAQQAGMTVPADLSTVGVEAFLRSVSRRSMDAFRAKVEAVIAEEEAADRPGEPTSP